ncbi:MAG: LLM class flavin-dependent oxidoreductase [SAR202 cluster bacterium]|nr:LLM class flavin-dependent oxidoreductase [SAR202 cluster bacterium]
MDFGMFMEFGRRQGASDADAFREGFALVDAAESWGLDEAWLAELHLNPTRSVLSSPVMTACSIATRTKRLRVGMAVYVLPLNHPLRIAEEAATIDQISEGRFDMGIGRSGFARAYDCYGISYAESRDRFREALDIILGAWKGEPFSYNGKYFHIDNATLSPLPYQKPHPPLRIAATTAESFPFIGAQGRPIFVGLRGMDIPELRRCLKEYRRAWKEAGHPGNGDAALRIPVYAGQTTAEALEEPWESINAYFGRMGNLYRESAGRAGIDATELRQGRADRLAGLSYDQMLETKVAFGTGEELVERFTQLKEDLGLDNVVAELNAGGLIPADRVMRSLKILTHQVMPEFK